MESWVVQWKEEQVKAGVKCLEVKKVNGNYYVYRSTTFWDKLQKKRRKKSEYLGKLDEKAGLVEGRKRRVSSSNIRGVFEYGNPALLDYTY
jgi:hypothetical protein